MLHHKFCIFSLILLLIFIYFYAKKENFDNTTATTIPSVTLSNTISFQLKNEIAKVLEISPSRIYNLNYEGDIKTNILLINFNILDGSVKYKTEKSQSQAEKQARELVNNDTFYISINNQAIKLRKMTTIKNDSAFFDNSVYFSNEGLKDISKYSNNKYITAPNDESLTKFYTLEFDKDYKLTPKLK
jgi:hypothetical protein